MAAWCVVNKQTGKCVRRYGGGKDGKAKARKWCAQLNRLNRRLFTIRLRR